MKDANAWRAEDVRVRLCFLVKVRNASGRRVAGGRSIGRTVDFAAGLSAGGALIGAVLRGLIGWTGVPNAGDEEGMRSDGTADGFSGRLVVAILVVVRVRVCCIAKWSLLLCDSTLRAMRSRVRDSVALMTLVFPATGHYILASNTRHLNPRSRFHKSQSHYIHIQLYRQNNNCHGRTRS